MMSGQKIDIFKLHRAEYKAGKKPAIIEAARAMYLAVAGSGAPGSDRFQTAIAALYGMAYTVKMGRKADGKGDYTIGKLEGVYWTADESDLGSAAVGQWCWNLMIRTPEVVDGFPITDEDLDTARIRLRDKKKDEGVDQVKLEFMEEGPCVQMLHVGPYDKEHETVSVMLGFCRENGYSPQGRHHEIYLSDPRRVAPENLKTILRLPVKPV
jgi:hypothetical protein